MRRWIRSPLTLAFSALLLAVTLSGGPAWPDTDHAIQQLPAEFDSMQAILVAWLPLGPIPDRPITDLSGAEIATLNQLSRSDAHANGHKWGHAFNPRMAERIKLKKGAGSPDPAEIDVDVYPYHYMMLDLVKAIIDAGVVAHIVTDNSSVAEQIVEFMIACGFKMHELKKLEFHYYWLDSIWIRDYGPWITRANNWLGVVDNLYYPTRPADDGFPEFFADQYGLTRTDFDAFAMEGGNILTDGMGRGYTTAAMLYYNPGLTPEAAAVWLGSVLNLDELVFVPGNPLEDLEEALAALGGTGHVDMGLKLLTPTKVMIGDFLPGSPGKDLMDRWADWFNSHENPDGDPYEVYRVVGATDGFSPYSYVNSVLVNRTVIVPQFGDPVGDAAAMDAYARAMPNYRRIGVRSELLPPLAGGLHCITKEIPRGVLKEDG